MDLREIQLNVVEGPLTTLKVMLATQFESSAIGTIRIVTMDRKSVSKWDVNQTGPGISQPRPIADSNQEMSALAGNPALHF